MIDNKPFAQFPIDLANARSLGKRLVEKAVKKI